MKYSVVIPAYNEEEVLHACHKQLTEVMKSLGEPYELIFVDDGSKDKTLQILKEISNEDENIRVISFSRNYGHQIAITAGMDYSKGEAVVVIDADLQDPPALIPKMIEKWKEGFHVVYAKRIKRKGESFFKKVTAKVYYRLLNSLTTIDIPVDTGDFRLIDRQIADILKNDIREKNRYIRGLVAWIGFNQTFIEYERDERLAGETKYPLKKMIKFAIDGLTSFSYKPLKIATKIGFIFSFAAFIHLCYVVIEALFFYRTNPGWASLMSVILFSQGIILIILGILGEYMGRIFKEAKDRPIYLVQEVLGYKEKET
ncbi:MAG: glycosyltransferase family 2 protein [Defluviitaleaceae bacterium]|nr:glycosyltransferase family 2 protein [Defluviitaleaceae bacterium]